MIIGDPIVVKIIERLLKRRLTIEEKNGQQLVRAGSQVIKIPQINVQYIHNKNSCK